MQARTWCMFDTCKIVHYFLFGWSAARTIFTTQAQTRSRSCDRIIGPFGAEFSGRTQPLGRRGSDMAGAGVGCGCPVSVHPKVGQSVGCYGIGHGNGSGVIYNGLAAKPADTISHGGGSECLDNGKPHTNGKGFGGPKPALHPSTGVCFYWEGRSLQFFQWTQFDHGHRGYNGVVNGIQSAGFGYVGPPRRVRGGRPCPNHRHTENCRRQTLSLRCCYWNTGGCRRGPHQHPYPPDEVIIHPDKSP